MANEIWNIDPSHSQVEFSVKHMMFATVKGSFTEFTGQITVPDGDMSKASVSATIQAHSVSTRDEKRDEHLRSNDFFGTGDNPTITFQSTGGSPAGEGKFKVNGNLTIKGITKPVTLDVTYNGQGVNPWGMTVAGFSAETKISRKDFGIEWNAPLEAGGVMVSDEVKISLEVEAAKQA
ncbi:MAG: YceI family protein [Chloroflexota bacterium]